MTSAMAAGEGRDGCARRPRRAGRHGRRHERASADWSLATAGLGTQLQHRGDDLQEPRLLRPHLRGHRRRPRPARRGTRSRRRRSAAHPCRHLCARASTSATGPTLARRSIAGSACTTWSRTPSSTARCASPAFDAGADRGRIGARAAADDHAGARRGARCALSRAARGARSRSRHEGRARRIGSCSRRGRATRTCRSATRSCPRSSPSSPVPCSMPADAEALLAALCGAWRRARRWTCRARRHQRRRRDGREPKGSVVDLGRASRPPPRGAWRSPRAGSERPAPEG